MRRIVVCAHAQQFRSWCIENDIKPNDPDVIYASGYRRLMGIHGPVEVIHYGTWWEHPEYPDIRLQLRLIEVSS